MDGWPGELSQIGIIDGNFAAGVCVSDIRPGRDDGVGPEGNGREEEASGSGGCGSWRDFLQTEITNKRIKVLT